jgi:hypothetical protein
VQEFGRVPDTRHLIVWRPTLDRRFFLKTGLVVSAAAALSRYASAQQASDPTPGSGWRSFEVTSRIEILTPEGVTQVWLPLPSVDAPAWVRNEGDFWSGNADSVKVVRERRYGAEILHAEWNATEAAPALEVISRFSTRDRMTDSPVRRIRPGWSVACALSTRRAPN